jgi:polysaccharide export outer membrane protein
MAPSRVTVWGGMVADFEPEENRSIDSEPQVIVTVVQPTSTAVTVTGEVTAGARVPLSTKGCGRHTAP